MRIFVTGSNGFAGSHLVDNLLAEGHHVWGLSRKTPQPTEHPQFDVLQGNLLDLERMKAIVAEVAPDVIYHLGGQAVTWKAWKDPATTLAINIGGTANLLEAAVAFGRPRVVVVTSAEIYGKIRPNQLPISERSIPKPRHPYGVSKHAAGELVRVYANRYDLPVVEARPFNHIGPRQSLGFVVPDFTSQVAKIKLGLIPAKMMVGNLSAERDFLDVRDVVRAYQMLAKKGQSGQAYLICSGHPVSIHTILNILLEHCDKPIEVAYDPARMRPSDIPVLYGTYAKIEKHVGWQPSYHMRNTLNDVMHEWLNKLDPSTNPLRNRTVNN